MEIIHVLLVDDNPDDRALTIRELKKEYKVKVREISDEKSYKNALVNNHFDIVITDYQLRWSLGLEILQDIKKHHPNCPVIMFTGTGNEEIAVSAMKAGLDDYVVKHPKHFVRVPVAVRLALKHANDREERTRAEKALYESEEKFRNIFESSPNAITVTDLDGNIIECNQAMLELHGFPSKDDVIGINAFDLIAKKDHDRAIENIKRTMGEGMVKNVEYTFLTKDGKEFPAELSAGVIMDLSGKPVSYMALTKDITDQKRAEEDMKKRTLKFRLDNGNLYITKESTPSLSLEAFKDLMRIGYFGFVASRTPEKDFKNFGVEGDFEFLWLAEKGKEVNKGSKLKKIENLIEELPRKNVVLIDRMDYLIFKNGFKKTLSFVQHLRELAYFKGSIVVITLDPATLSKQELRLVEKEGLKIEPRLGKTKLPDVFFKILKFLYEENTMGIKPSYMNIGRELKISKPTVRKRVKYLISSGYILESINGRNKVVELTELGRNLFFI